MPLEKSQTIKLYLHRLFNSILPDELGAEYTQTLTNELLQDFSAPSNSPSTPSATLEKVKSLLLASGNRESWIQVNEIAHQLTQYKSPAQIALYLEFLLNILPQQPQQKKTKLSPVPLLPVPMRLPSSPDASMYQMARPYLENDNEQTVIDSLKNTLLGIDSAVFSFQDDSVNINIKLSLSLTEIAADFCELALLYRHLCNTLTSIQHSLNSPIKMALLRCLKSSLDDYNASINTIFQSSPTSLAVLLHALHPHFHSLRLLAHLQQRLESKTGFQLLCDVFELSNFGDLEIQAAAKSIFNEIVVPYYEYLEHWILKGSLVDENQEFFVHFDSEKEHINDIIIYVEQNTPAFLGITPDACLKIFHIGKTLIFLEKFCSDLEWVNSFFQRYSAYITQKHHCLRAMDADLLQKLIINQYDEVMCRLNTLVYTKYDLFEHLQNLKRIMMLCSHDLVDSLNLKGYKLFSEPALSLISSRLTELLSDGIEGSTIKNLPARFRNRIDARILDLSHGNIAWEVFTLEYKLPEPALQSILNHNKQLTGYLRLFNFLWCLKHSQFLLQDNYTLFASLKRKYLKKSEADISRNLRSVNLIRNRLLSFLNILLKYICSDLIEENFQKIIVEGLFKGKHAKSNPFLDDAYADALYKKNQLPGLEKENKPTANVQEHTIDELVQIHDTFLDKVGLNKLFSEGYYGEFSGQLLINQVYDFLEIVFAFVSSSEEFGATVVNYVNVTELDAREEDMERLHVRMGSLVRVMNRDLYQGRFLPKKANFTKDLRADIDLKELSKMLA